MADTQTHDTSCFVAAGVGTILSIAAFNMDQPLTAYYIGVLSAGMLSGIIISPDWDWSGKLVKNKYSSRVYIIKTYPREDEEVINWLLVGRVMRRWKRLKYLYPWLILYALMFNHRGIAHYPIIGTMTRIAWLIPLCIIPMVAVVSLIGALGLFDLYQILAYSFLVWSAGLVIIDTIHLILDQIIKIH